MPFIPDLQLTIQPTYALHTQIVPDLSLTVNEDSSQGRTAIIVDINNSDGLYSRDIGTIFIWPVAVPTILSVWQPSIIPLDEDLYERLSFHFLIKSLGGVGWQHVREMNLAFQSTTDLNLELQFDDEAVPNVISINIPNSGGQVSKVKITMPPNKWKMIELFVNSAQPFLLWTNDMEFKIKSWGSAEPYRNLKPINA